MYEISTMRKIKLKINICFGKLEGWKLNWTFTWCLPPSSGQICQRSPSVITRDSLMNSVLLCVCVTVMAAGELYPFEDMHINTHRRINVWRYFLACPFNSLKAFALYSCAKHPRGHLITLSPLKGRLITLSNTTVHLRGQVFDLPKSLPTRPICGII